MPFPKALKLSDRSAQFKKNFVKLTWDRNQLLACHSFGNQRHTPTCPRTHPTLPQPDSWSDVTTDGPRKYGTTATNNLTVAFSAWSTCNFKSRPISHSAATNLGRDEKKQDRRASFPLYQIETTVPTHGPKDGDSFSYSILWSISYMAKKCSP